MSAGYTLEVRLTGAHIRPDQIGARDSAVLIAAIETVIAALLPEPAGADEVIVSLAGVRADGFALTFTTAQPEIVEAAFSQVIGHMQRGTLDDLPPRALDALRGALRVTRRHGAALELHAGTATRRGRAEAAAFPPDLILSAAGEATVRGTRTVYGAVVRVGGEEPPRARLRLLNGNVLTCDLARRKGWTLARELGARLYQTIGARGEAHIRISDGALIRFRIDRLLPYAPIGMGKALDGLAEASGALAVDPDHSPLA